MKKFSMLLMVFAAAAAAVTAGIGVYAEENVVLQTEYGEVIKKGSKNKVVLYGTKKNGSAAYTDIYIEVFDDNDKSAAVIKVATNYGYSPRILLANFTGEEKQQVYLNIDSGGSGAFSYTYVYSVDNGNVVTMFDWAHFDREYIATYEDGYKLSVEEKYGKEKYVIDISARSEEYLSELYGKDGKLTEPAEGNVSMFNSAFPFLLPSDNVYCLIVFQKITGLYQADGFGYVQHLMRYGKDGFKDYSTGIYITG